MTPRPRPAGGRALAGGAAVALAGLLLGASLLPGQQAGAPRPAARPGTPPPAAVDSCDSFEFDQPLDLPTSRGGGFLQDRDGFFWIGTQHGLVKWNGRSTQFYTPQTSALGASIVNGLIEDRSGAIWVATSNAGLYRYDKGTDRFTAFRANPSDPTSLSSDLVGTIFTSVLALDPQGHVWAGTVDRGVNRYDPATGRFTRFRHDPLDAGSLDSDRVLSVHAGHSGRVWIGTVSGLNLFDAAAGKFIHVRVEAPTGAAPAALRVSAVWESPGGLVWVGLQHGGLWTVDLRGEAGGLAMVPDPRGAALASQWVVALLEDPARHLWVLHGSDRASVLDIASGRVAHCAVSPTSPNTLKGGNLRALAVDRTGAVWVNGAQQSNRFDPLAAHFRLTLPTEDIYRIYEDRRGDLWLDPSGMDYVIRFDRRTLRAQRFPMPAGPHSPVLHDSKGRLWVAGNGPDGSSGFLHRMDRDTGRILESFPLLDQMLTTDLIEDVRDPDVLWIDSYARGLGRFNARTREFRTFVHDPADPASLSDDISLELIKDRGDPTVLWVGTEGGLDRFDTKTLRAEHFRHDPANPRTLSGNRIRAVVDNGDGSLWVGVAGGGLNRLDKRTGSVTRYVVGSSESEQNVNNILVDGDGRLWLGSPETITRFDPRDALSRTFRRYEGVFRGPNWTGAAIRDSDGWMWFGGTGLTSFRPDHIPPNLSRPPVVLTRLAQDGVPIPLAGATERAAEIRLPWRRNYFEFEAAALDFRQPAQNRYRHILEGSDRGWFNAGSSNGGRYSGLAPGTYTLRVQGANSDGIWSDREARLIVTVEPPFWATWWFRLAALAAVAAMAATAVRLRVRALTRRSVELEALNATLRRESEAHQRANRELAAVNVELGQKNAELERFTYTVSHDLKAPLVTIKGFAGMLRKDVSAGSAELVDKDVSFIAKAADKMYRLLDELLEFSRAGRTTRPVARVSLAEIVADARTLIPGLEASSRIAVVVQPDLPDVVGDRDRLRQVYQNLLDNARKFMGDQPQPRIEVGARPEGTQVVCWVKDNGIGVDPRYHEHVFGLFEKLDPAGEGTGVGLALVRRIVDVHGGRTWLESDGVGRGATFYFTLPAAGAPAVVPPVA